MLLFEYFSFLDGHKVLTFESSSLIGMWKFKKTYKQAQLRAEVDRLGCLSSNDVWTLDNQLHGDSIQPYYLLYTMSFIYLFFYI